MQVTDPLRLDQMTTPGHVRAPLCPTCQTAVHACCATDGGGYVPVEIKCPTRRCQSWSLYVWGPNGYMGAAPLPQRSGRNEVAYRLALLRIGGIPADSVRSLAGSLAAMTAAHLAPAA